ncbi:MAG: hypothetical protein U1B30_02335 [Pseudomonadota bacterium]|nr:hypothetical protein [Pseudomonadota bacterium]
MKEVLRMFAYAAVGIAMIALMIKVTSSTIMPAGMEIALALVVVVVLPLVIMFAATRRKKTS